MEAKDQTGSPDFTQAHIFVQELYGKAVPEEAVRAVQQEEPALTQSVLSRTARRVRDHREWDLQEAAEEKEDTIFMLIHFTPAQCVFRKRQNQAQAEAENTAETERTDQQEKHAWMDQEV